MKSPKKLRYNTSREGSEILPEDLELEKDEVNPSRSIFHDPFLQRVEPNRYR